MFNSIVICWTVVLIFVLLAHCRVDAQEISVHPCSTVGGKPPKYQVGGTDRTGGKVPPTLLVYISIKPKSFIGASMIKLFQKLKKDYTQEKRVRIVVYDTYESAKTNSFHEHSRYYMRDLAAWRGEMFWDNSTGESFIRFSTERRKPRDEIKIDCGNSAEQKK